MSWLTIIGIVLQVLQMAGVFDWVLIWLRRRFESPSVLESNLPGDGLDEKDAAAAVGRLFDMTRPGWYRPVARIVHGLARGIAERNIGLIASHVVGSRAGLPIDPANVRPMSDYERSLISNLQESFSNGDDDMHDDFISMVEDMTSTFGVDHPTAAGANTENIFFDGTIISLIRQFKAAGVSDWLKWLPVVLQLITTIGPKVKEIWKIIEDAINGGKTPNGVMSDLVVARS